MIELLNGEMGTLQMVLAWLLVCYPVVTLPVLIRFLSLSEDSEESRGRRGAPRSTEVDEEYEEPRRPRRPRAEELWQAEQAHRSALPVAAPSNALTLNQLLDVLEEASHLERVAAEPTRRTRGVDSVELEHLLEFDADPAVPDTIAARRIPQAPPPPPPPPPARQPQSLADRRDRRTREAARRVAGNPRMQRWVRSAARQLLARTGTEG